MVIGVLRRYEAIRTKAVHRDYSKSKKRGILLCCGLAYLIDS